MTLNEIIGYNTIEHLVTNCKDKLNISESLVNVIGNLSVEKVESMVNIVEAGGEISELTVAAKLEKSQVIFPGNCEKLRCKIKDLRFRNGNKKLVMFSPFEEFCVEKDVVIFESTEDL